MTLSCIKTQMLYDTTAAVSFTPFHIQHERVLTACPHDSCAASLCVLLQ